MIYLQLVQIGNLIIFCKFFVIKDMIYFKILSKFIKKINITKMKYFIYLVLSLLFLKAHCNINECTILQMQDEEICPGMSSICELQVYFFNYPESFPSELMDENLRNKKIARMFKLYTSPNILEKWEKKNGEITPYYFNDPSHF